MTARKTLVILATLSIALSTAWFAPSAEAHRCINGGGDNCDGSACANDGDEHIHVQTQASARNGLCASWPTLVP